MLQMNEPGTGTASIHRARLLIWSRREGELQMPSSPRAGESPASRWLCIALAAALMVYALAVAWSEDPRNAIVTVSFFLTPFAALLVLLRDMRWHRKLVAQVAGHLHETIPDQIVKVERSFLGIGEVGRDDRVRHPANDPRLDHGAGVNADDGGAVKNRIKEDLAGLRGGDVSAATRVDCDVAKAAEVHR